ncbi:hypothetical protein [Dysgonomonas termitidis]|uniref:Uncharacterized protein n=1 Tax=Dysgonomonas termitidis TaxID=1516126 RepID=A0ABV9KTQ1_9BACT
MKANDLIKGRLYRYTANRTDIPVVYLYETINGYIFSAGGVKKELSTNMVKSYIEEYEG